MSIQAWLGEKMLKTDFVAHHYGKLPYSQPGADRALCELASWTTLGNILMQPQADVMVVRQNEQYAGQMPRSLDEAHSLIAQGYTVLVRHAERHDQRLAELAQGFVCDFAAPVDLHMYATPAGHYGFGWHYDCEDVFILQTMGRKEYALRKNTVHPWPVAEAMPQNMQYPREIMPLMRCRLNAGDWLYIPAGYWHKADAEEMALSVAVGLMTPPALVLLDRLRRELTQSLLWRQRLPIRGAACPASRAELQDQLRNLCQELADDLARRMLHPSLISDWIDEAARAEI